MNEFLGLSLDLLKKLRETLSLCRAFQSEASLRSLFADSRIQLWSGRLSFSPENKEEFINRTINDFSYLEHAQFKKNGLVLLLEVLTDQESKWDAKYRKLKELVAEVQQELLKKRVGGSFGYKLDRLRQLFQTWDGESNAPRELLEELKKEFPEENQYFEVWDYLFEIVESPEKNMELLFKCRHLPEECIYAYIFAYRKVRDSKEKFQKIQSSLIMAYYYLPVEEVPDYLQDNLAEIVQEQLNREQHIRKWPLQTGKHDLLRQTDNKIQVLVEELLALHNAPQVKLFWIGHPLFQLLQHTTFSGIIYGNEGVGKSLLAYALSQHSIKNQNEWVLVSHFQSCPTNEKLIQNFLFLLGKFIFANPLFLGRLQSNQLRFFAQLLMSQHDSELHFQAKIEQVQNGCSQAEWVKTIRDQEQQKSWVRLAHRLLGRLAKKGIGLSPLPPNWDGLVTCAQALGFQKLLAVIDSSIEDAELLQTELLPQVPSWQKQDVQVLVFAPTALKTAIDRSVRQYGLPTYNLTWDEDNLKKMLESVFRELFPKTRETVYDYLEADAIEWLIEYSKFNPYRLVQCLQIVTGVRGDGNPLTKEKGKSLQGQLSEWKGEL